MSKEIRLGLDMDGVVFDFTTRCSQWVRRLFGVTLPAVGDTYPTEWDWLDTHITKEQDRELWRTIGQSDNFWQNLPIYNHSSRVLDVALSKAKKLYYITSRSGNRVQYQTERALIGLVGPGNFTGGVIPAARAEDKIPLINALKLTHFVDDKAETVDLANSTCFSTKVAVWDQPWNRHVIFAPTVTRLTNAEEFDQWLT